jgi:hypothetical protein
MHFGDVARLARLLLRPDVDVRGSAGVTSHEAVEATMIDSSSGALVERVERLERDARRWKLAAGLGGLVVAALGVMGAGSTRTLDAHKFVLRDSANRPRAELATDGDRSLALRFKDDAGIPRATFGVENDSAILVLADRSAKPRAVLSVLPHGAPSLTLYDEAGKARAELSLTREGVPALTTFDREGLVKSRTP